MITVSIQTFIVLLAICFIVGGFIQELIRKDDHESNKSR